MRPSAARPSLRLLRLAAILLVAVGPAYGLRPAAAQTCFDYVDGCDRPDWDLPSALPNCQNALAPFECVEEGNLTTECRWDPDEDGVEDCHLDVIAGNCCTTKPAPPGTAQSILEMHTAWHECFGNVGNRLGNNPPQRGQRWYAFHRQFEYDFNRWRDDAGFGPIQAVEWCPDMELEIGHTSGGWPAFGAGAHPAQCGTGPDRPYIEGDGTAPDCPFCIAFPQCFFHTVGGAPGGPAACPDEPSTLCGVPDGDDPGGAPDLDLGYDSLDDFPDVEELATVLDAYFHGQMHAAVGVADRFGATCNPFAEPPVTTNCYVLDVIASNCSPRDPMFWRLHHALDDVVRAWQDRKPVDVMVVIDRSGSMLDPAVGGGTKLDAALEALDMFAALLDDCESDPASPAACDLAANRIGVVSYSDGVSAELELTEADETLRSLGGPIPTAIADIAAIGPGGCTGIGLGLTEALACLGGNCPSSPGSATGSANARKGILLLTDGVENVPPCLDPEPGVGPTCGSSCFGPAFDAASMNLTQLAAVGFGQGGSLNGDLLTLLAERQGGLYLENPNLATDDDLKEFFTKAFGQLTDEFLVTDPRGVLAAGEAATEPVEYTSCADDKLTFASGWQGAAAPGLKLLVNAPSGRLVLAGEPTVEREADPTWEFARLDLPHRGEGPGTWTAQLVRPHQAYVNGFATDAFADPEAGAAIVRREIQRLCPDGCREVLYFEQGRIADPSVYALAIKAEVAAGVLGRVERPPTGARFAAALRRGRWDLIVFARMGPERTEPYDSELARLLCRERQGPRAIVTDTRRTARELLACLGASPDGSLNWQTLRGDGRLFSGVLKLINPGHQVATYGLAATAGGQATAGPGPGAGVVARVPAGAERPWFIDVLGRGLSKLELHNPTLERTTDRRLIASARVLPSYVPRGGWDHVDARVEVVYPKVGLGTLLARRGLGDPVRVGGELLDPRAAAVRGLAVPTGTAVFPLYDDGTHGDLHARNHYWSTELAGIGSVDGAYRLRFLFDFTKNGCTTRRELLQSVHVELAVDPQASQPRVVDRVDLPYGGWRTVIAVRPADRYGNLWGPGRAAGARCAEGAGCKLTARVEDDGQGGYTLAVETARGVAAARFEAFGSRFEVPVPCDRCPRLEALELAAAHGTEHGVVEGEVVLAGPAPPGGAVVTLESSDRRIARAPAEVVVAAGERSARFTLRLLHAHAGPGYVDVVARYGADSRAAKLAVLPLVKMRAEPPVVDPTYPMHGGAPGGHGSPGGHRGAVPPGG